jgi:hypothetical protein
MIHRSLIGHMSHTRNTPHRDQVVVMRPNSSRRNAHGTDLGTYHADVGRGAQTPSPQRLLAVQPGRGHQDHSCSTLRRRWSGGGRRSVSPAGLWTYRASGSVKRSAQRRCWALGSSSRRRKLSFHLRRAFDGGVDVGRLRDEIERGATGRRVSNQELRDVRRRPIRRVALEALEGIR